MTKAAIEVHQWLRQHKQIHQKTPLTIEEQRHSLSAMGTSPFGPAIRANKALEGGVPGKWIEPLESQSECGLYLHGRAYDSSVPDSDWAMAARLAHASQTRILLLDYHLAPENQTRFLPCLKITRRLDPKSALIGGNSAAAWP